ncbi:unnamed protein product [Soboliphyme baturini]|uniref:Secreted protein n=1 Tax=Soboliphyme baturini TaxID=241478 RepID=A0A183IHF3_9BILA|nr:unnamed protein product [Soboliphyme baturini]
MRWRWPFGLQLLDVGFVAMTIVHLAYRRCSRSTANRAVGFSKFHRMPHVVRCNAFWTMCFQGRTSPCVGCVSFKCNGAIFGA